MNEVKGKATVNVFKTTTSEGARVSIPKKIVEAIKIEKGDIFRQVVVGRHIEMKKTCIIDNDTVSIMQFNMKSGDSIKQYFKTYLLKNVMKDLRLKDKDILLFEFRENKIFIKKM